MTQIAKRTTGQLLDKLVSSNRMQLNRLETLERQEMKSQKEVSDTWVKYMYLLIEYTLARCRGEDVLLHNLDEFEQTLTFRKCANELREQCGIPPYSVVYDPLDAKVIVEELSTGSFAQAIGMDTMDTDQIVKALEEKHGRLVQTVKVRHVVVEAAPRITLTDGMMSRY